MCFMKTSSINEPKLSGRNYSRSEYDAALISPVKDSSPPEFVYGMQPLAMAEWVAVLFDHIIDKYGGETSLNEFRVMNQVTLCYLRGISPCSFGCLVANTPVKRSTISYAVSRLVQRGYLRDEIDQSDRRRRQIYLTESFLAEVMGHFNMLEVALPEEF